MIERIAIVLLGLAIAAGAGVIIWAVRRSNAKRARLAAVYDEWTEDTEPLDVPPVERVQELELRVQAVKAALLPAPPLVPEVTTIREREPCGSRGDGGNEAA